jgi:hypothetical protein
MPLLAEAWRSYERNVLPRDAPRAERRETRIAFYAGAQALLNLARHGGGERAVAERLDELAMELGEFAAEMRREALCRNGRRSAV